MEEAVLGGILLESEAFGKVRNIIGRDSFYKDSNGLIFATCELLAKKSDPIDILSVMNALLSSGDLDTIGGAVYLTGLTSKVASASHIEYHARIVQQKYLQRQVIQISSMAIEYAYGNETDISETLEFLEKAIFEIKTGASTKEPRLLSDIGVDQIKILEDISTGKITTGIRSGVDCLDKIMNRFQKQLLYYFAARPGMGKTTLIVSASINMAINDNLKPAIFSLEMSEGDLWKKYTGDVTGISTARLSNVISEDDWSRVEAAQRKFQDINVFIDDTASMTIYDIQTKARRLKSMHDIDIVFIDYLQLIKGSGVGNREQQVSEISRALKVMAKELDIPVVCLSQLNRGCEQRPDKKPMLQDLRESGSIEQDADFVGFLYRPEYYGFLTYDDDTSTINMVDVIAAKNRGGITGEVSFKRTREFTKFYDNEIEEINPVETNEDLTPDAAF